MRSNPSESAAAAAAGAIVQRLDQARAAGRRALSEADGKALLADCGVRVPGSTVVTAVEDVPAALAGLQAPFVVKVVSPEILHKSDAGGVALGLVDAEAVQAAIRTMAEKPLIAAARVDGYLVEEMLPRGLEIVVGAVQDPQFGPMVMVGLGGIFVEVLKDVTFRLCPIVEADAVAMLDELRGAALLDGVRGEPGVDRAALVDVLLRIAGEDGLLLRSGGRIAELDINPLIAMPDGVVAVDARVVLAEEVAEPALVAETETDTAVREFYEPLFRPATVAVVGASTTTSTMANTFIRRMKAYGYQGTIYPIHPKADVIEDLPVFRSLADVPETIDYAYIVIAAPRVPALLAAAGGKVRFAQVLSSGFGETPEGQALEAELVAAAREGGCRLIGPNCLGMYSPRGRVTFPVHPPEEVGSVGVVSQSGGLGTDIIKRGQWRGVRFSGLVTVGNSADIGPVDLLRFYLADPQTRVIGLYLEGLRDGRRLFETLRTATVSKPVVILKGGRSAEGHAAAASHTGALAGNQRAWDALCAQTPCLMVETVDAFIGTLLALQNLELRPERPTREVVLFGNGGGTGVLATDSLSELGLRVQPFAGEARAALEALNLPPGTSVANPVDAPVATLQGEGGLIAGRILDLIYAHTRPDAIVMHLNLASFVGRGDNDPLANLIRVAEQARHAHPGRAHFVLVLRADGSAELDDTRRTYRQRALDAGIPVYDEIVDAALALAGVRHLESRLGG